MELLKKIIKRTAFPTLGMARDRPKDLTMPQMHLGSN